jgi:hypothetical protein
MVLFEISWKLPTTLKLLVVRISKYWNSICDVGSWIGYVGPTDTGTLHWEILAGKTQLGMPNKESLTSHDFPSCFIDWKTKKQVEINKISKAFKPEI